MSLLRRRALINVATEFVPEFQAVYDFWIIKPSIELALRYNTMVEGWVNSGVWAKEDVIYVFAIHTNDNSEAQTNWKNPGTFDVVLVNDPAFIPFEGFKMDRFTQHLETNYNPAINGINLIQNNANLSLYVRDNINEPNCDIGGFELLPDLRLQIFTRIDDKYICSINDLTILEPANIDSRGFHVATRISVNERSIYKNKILVIADSVLSIGVPNINIPIGARNGNGVIVNRASKQYAYASLGGGLTQQNVNDKTDIFETYMDSNGKGVIP